MSEDSSRAVVLAGGKGRRLAPYTTVFPKPLVPIDDRPILEILVRQLVAAGFGHITLSVGHLAELIQAYFANGIDGLDATFDFVREDRPLGTAGALATITDLPSTFLVANGDLLTTLDFRRLLEFHRQGGAALTIATRQRSVDIDFGVIEVGQGGEVAEYREKPVLDYMVSMGVYVYERTAVDLIEPGEHLDFPDLVNRLLDRGEKVLSFASQDFWLDIGRPDDYEEAVEAFGSRRDEFL